MKVLLSPITWTYQQLMDYRREMASEININAQVGVMENYLNRKYTGTLTPYPYIEVIGDQTGVVVMVMDTYANRISEIEADIRKYLPAGKKLSITTKSN